MDDPQSLNSLPHTVHELVRAIPGGRRTEVSQLISIGDPVEVLIRVDAFALHIEMPLVEWHGHTPVMSGKRLASFTLDAARSQHHEMVEMIEKARSKRLARFRTCRECGTRTPPEWLHGPRLCQGCAAQNHRVVY